MLRLVLRLADKRPETAAVGASDYVKGNNRTGAPHRVINLTCPSNTCSKTTYHMDPRSRRLS